jgi:hypothetical protein
MKRIAYLIVIVIFSGFLTGMGSTGESAPVAVPEPETDYTVVLVDQSDVSMDLEKFSCDGQVFISGKRGNAHISIPFQKISSVQFFLKDGVLTADVRLKNESFVTITVEKDQPCYGTLSYGSMKINMEDIKSITFKNE